MPKNANQQRVGTLAFFSTETHVSQRKKEKVLNEDVEGC
jgi:hypothetical protein